MTKNGKKDNAYRLMHATTTKCLHGTLGGSGIIVLNKAVVEALGLSHELEKDSESMRGVYKHSCRE